MIIGEEMRKGNNSISLLNQMLEFIGTMTKQAPARCCDTEVEKCVSEFLSGLSLFGLKEKGKR